MNEDTTDTNIEPITQLTRDLRKAAADLHESEARYLVDLYYQMQDHRIRAMAQVRSGVETGEPNAVLRWVLENADRTERGIKSALGFYAKTQRRGRWLLSVHGIGPVLAAGLMAHIDITRAPSVGHIWRYAGLDPTVEWKPKTKRPWNAQLKVLCWKIGQSFMKARGSENDMYGQLYAARKVYEGERNARGGNAKAAKEFLAKRKVRSADWRFYYEQGHLPPQQIDARARRWAVKLFLSNLHHVFYECHYGEPPAKPYTVLHQGHVDYMPPPNWPVK